MITVLHIGYADDDGTSGVSVAIPKMVKAQSDYANVLFLNLYNSKKTDNTVFYSQYNTISKLPIPFSNPDIVVFHELYRSAFLKLYKECVNKKIPYVIIPHGGLTEQAQKKKRYKKIPANILFFNSYFEHADAIQYLSINEMKESIIKKNYYILGNGMPTISREKRALNDSTRIVFIGRYDIYFKGLDILLQAIKLVKNDLREKKIVIELYGRGIQSDEEQLRKYIQEYGLQDVVKMKGPIFGGEKIHLLLDADYFIQTSRSEGQPLGVLEALSLGVPVIVTPGTTMKNSVIEYDMGFTCELEAKDIGEKIILAHNMKKRFGEMSEHALMFIKNNYDEHVIAEKAIEELKKILGE